MKIVLIILLIILILSIIAISKSKFGLYGDKWNLNTAISATGTYNSLLLGKLLFTYKEYPQDGHLISNSTVTSSPIPTSVFIFSFTTPTTIDSSGWGGTGANGYPYGPLLIYILFCGMSKGITNTSLGNPTSALSISSSGIASPYSEAITTADGSVTSGTGNLLDYKNFFTKTYNTTTGNLDTNTTNPPPYHYNTNSETSTNWISGLPLTLSSNTTHYISINTSAFSKNAELIVGGYYRIGVALMNNMYSIYKITDGTTLTTTGRTTLYPDLCCPWTTFKFTGDIQIPDHTTTS
jgi:hypothetical protein